MEVRYQSWHTLLSKHSSVTSVYSLSYGVSSSCLCLCQASTCILLFPNPFSDPGTLLKQSSLIPSLPWSAKPDTAVSGMKTKP